MALAEIIYAAQSGSVTDYAVPFGFLDRDHVYATVDGASVSFTWQNDGLIRISPAPTGEVRIYRDTPKDKTEVTFVDASTHSAKKHNTQNYQNLYILQEIFDALLRRLSTDGFRWDAEGQRLTNLADPEAAQDATTRSWVNNRIDEKIDDADEFFMTNNEFGNWNARNQRILNVEDPLVATDAATRGWTVTQVNDADTANRTWTATQVADAIATALVTNGFNWDGDGKRLVNLADPTSAQDAATRGWTNTRIAAEVSTAIATALVTNGFNWDADNKRIIGLADPTSAQDAATRGWVISRISSELTALGSLTPSDLTALEEDVTALQTLTSTLESAVTGLQGLTGFHAADIATLQGQVSTLESDVAALQANGGGGGSTDTTQIEADIDALEVSMASAQSDISALTTAQTATNAALTTAEGEIDALQAAVAAAEADIDALQAASGNSNVPGFTVADWDIETQGTSIVFKNPTGDTRLRLSDTGNLEVSGNITAFADLSVSAGASSTYSVSIGDWAVEGEGTSLVFKDTNGTKRLRLSATGDLEVTGNVTAFASIN